MRDDGHAVQAGARDLDKVTGLWWHELVDHVEIDVLDARSVETAVSSEVDAIVYLVHGMARDGFADADHVAAQNVARAADSAGVERIVYVSGIIPDVPEDELSAHLRSRLDVERVLSASSADVITLRAAMVFGGGSTSFELMRQLADRLPVTVIPGWMRHRVEPIAVADLTRAIVGALEAHGGTCHFDVGGGEAVLYPDLVQRYTELAGTQRPQLNVGFLPEKLIAQVASWVADIPSPTVKALMESLQHDMVAADSGWRSALLPRGAETLTIDDAIARALVPLDGDDRRSQDPMRGWRSDPEWAS
ncbi:NAD(P)H-binding protein [Microbacterium indicum]|uniref:NAD(P)H-binding protein n=1 Tax=Microbacterium indicum TaxID=358100 RepID=UPI001FE15D81|nr:NAD(P)H-binding protein [Microbacterium indicum]